MHILNPSFISWTRAFEVIRIFWYRFTVLISALVETGVRFSVCTAAATLIAISFRYFDFRIGCSTSIILPGEWKVISRWVFKMLSEHILRDQCAQGTRTVLVLSGVPFHQIINTGASIIFNNTFEAVCYWTIDGSIIIVEILTITICFASVIFTCSCVDICSTIDKRP